MLPNHRLMSAFVLGTTLASAGAAQADPCRVPGIAQQVVCGSVPRALDPQRPSHGTIDIHYVIVPALARNKLPDPVLLLAGGPGQSAISLAGAVLPLLSRLNNRRDLIFIDQRGTGRSAALECDPQDDIDIDIAARFDPEQQRAALATCRQRLASLPYLKSEQDLRYFTTTIAMNDVDAVRRQLGIDKLNLIGASYGSRAALELLRLHPSSVRRTVLDGVAPPDMALPASMSIDSQSAFDQVFASCERETDCHAAYPDLRAVWQQLLTSLPKKVELRDPRSGRIESMQLSRDMLLGMVRSVLYLPIAASALPAAIGFAASGRYEPLAALTTLVQPRPSRRAHEGIATGMHFSVVCSEDVPLLQSKRFESGRDFGTTIRRAYEQICADWPRGTVDPGFYRVAPSRSAVLMLSGGIDPATPPRHAADIAARLGAKASHRVIANAGHGLISIGCVRDVVFHFIDAPGDDAALAVDSDCVESIPRPPAFLPPSVQAPG